MFIKVARLQTVTEVARFIYAATGQAVHVFEKQHGLKAEQLRSALTPVDDTIYSGKLPFKEMANVATWETYSPTIQNCIVYSDGVDLYVSQRYFTHYVERLWPAMKAHVRRTQSIA